MVYFKGGGNTFPAEVLDVLRPGRHMRIQQRKAEIASEILELRCIVDYRQPAHP